MIREVYYQYWEDFRNLEYSNKDYRNRIPIVEKIANGATIESVAEKLGNTCQTVSEIFKKEYKRFERYCMGRIAQEQGSDIIERYNFSERTYSALKRNNIRTRHDIEESAKQGFENIHQLGSTGIKEIQEKLKLERISSKKIRQKSVPLYGEGTYSGWVIISEQGYFSWLKCWQKDLRKALIFETEESANETAKTYSEAFGEKTIVKSVTIQISFNSGGADSGK